MGLNRADVFDDIKRYSRPDSTPAEAARVGEELRDARMALGLSVEDMANSLRIRRLYLAALEEGRLRDLPAPAYVLGFVRAYARALGLDDDDMVRRFREAGAGAEPKTSELVFPEPVPERGVPAGAIILLGIVVIVASYVGWYHWTGGGHRTVDAVPALPGRLSGAADEALAGAQGSGGSGQGSSPGAAANPANGAAASAARGPNGSVAGAQAPGMANGGAALPPAALSPSNPGATPSVVPNGANPPAMVVVPSSNAAAAAAALPAAPSGSAGPAAQSATPPAPGAERIVLHASADCWIQLRDPASKRVLVNRVLQPGENFSVPAQPAGLMLTVGNAAGLTMTVDGQSVPLPGTGVSVRRNLPMDADLLKSGSSATPTGTSGGSTAPR